MDYLPSHRHEPPPRRPVPAGSDEAAARVLDHLPESRTRVYDVRKILRAVMDRDSLFELEGAFGRAAVTALARLDGQSSATRRTWTPSRARSRAAPGPSARSRPASSRPRTDSSSRSPAATSTAASSTRGSEESRDAGLRRREHLLQGGRRPAQGCRRQPAQAPHVVGLGAPARRAQPPGSRESRQRSRANPGSGAGSTAMVIWPSLCAEHDSDSSAGARNGSR